MKKLLSVVLATLMLISVFPFALPQTVTASTTERIAYLDGQNGEDTSADLGNKNKAFATFNAAYDALAAEGGGKLVLIGRYESGSITKLATHYDPIVITALDKATAPLVLKSGATFKAGGPVTFENLRIVAAENVYFFGNFHHITMGEGITCEKTEGTALKDGATGTVAVLGGALDIQSGLNTHVTIKSGVYRAVAGGSRCSSDSKINNGTFRLDIEGGYMPYAFGGNWIQGGSMLGGQAYIRMTAGTVKQLIIGGQSQAQASLLNSVLYISGGHITDSIRCEFMTGMTTIVYSGEITSNLGATYTYKGTSAETSAGQKEINATKALKSKTGDIKVTAQTRASSLVNIVPAANYEVHVSSTGKTGATGAAGDPIRYLHQAIAMLTENGGKIILDDDYTFDKGETNSYQEFNAFPHNGTITIDGVDGRKLIGLAKNDKTEYSATDKNGNTYTAQVTSGLATYNAGGDTTFANVTFDTPKTRDVNICANFNELVMNDVEMSENCGDIRLVGGAYNFTSHYGYTSSFNANYYSYGEGNPTITVDSGKYVAVVPYSRLADDKTEVAFTYPGKATVNLCGTATVTNLYSSSVGSANAHNMDVEINLYGDALISNAIWFGGDGTGKGTIDGDLTLHQYEDANVARYGTAVNNCTKNRYLIIDSDYASYQAVLTYFGDVEGTTVTTNIAAPAFGAAEFGVRYDSENSYSLRYISSLPISYFVGEDASKYNIVEVGVLVKTAENTNSFKYVQGKESYRGISAEAGVENVNPETKIAKSVIYVKDKAIDRYMWAGEDDATVDFVAPITELPDEYYGTEFTFCPYIVITDNNGARDKMILGEAVSASISAEVENILDGADPDNYTAKQIIAAKIYAEAAN